ncbi:unnamed protein product [Fusarium graminearum]|uniref:Uncharacterized protein n=1 Tax=Gibberella zeae TaxID=5518 RepID=A0A4E9D3A7_GIBZA|nr:unnamed protein product [Fusarium graminearum]CAG1962484.1 unnamed protein product [Fusarium graminearum]CAG1995689.1 unnamed protein product [Fusarium graminearum]
MNDADDVQDPPFDMTIAADLVNASRRFRVLLEASCCICLTSVLDSTAPFQDILISNTLLNSRDEHIYNSTRSASLGCSGPRFPPLNPPAADKPTRSVPYLLHTIPYLADAVARVKNTSQWKDQVQLGWELQGSDADRGPSVTVPNRLSQCLRPLTLLWKILACPSILKFFSAC